MRETKRREDGWEMKGMKGRLRLRSIRERRGWMGDEVIEGACEGLIFSTYSKPRAVLITRSSRHNEATLNQTVKRSSRHERAALIKRNSFSV
ncbi:hypothetical protein SO802_005132 [Lithocarpus litseifolius]|uniref:Uncharacterized protein n=1 Tax=Lithocarpus litseifolius TaxID=425828 RepID=A0AAW2DIV2_9ROSI